MSAEQQQLAPPAQVWISMFDAVFDNMKKECREACAEQGPRMLQYMVRASPPQDDPTILRRQALLVKSHYVSLIRRYADHLEHQMDDVIARNPEQEK
jgi:ABC-type uncharacterized transport system permease subunit